MGAGFLTDKTMANKLMSIPNDDTQNSPSVDYNWGGGGGYQFVNYFYSSTSLVKYNIVLSTYTYIVFLSPDPSNIILWIRTLQNLNYFLVKRYVVF